MAQHIKVLAVKPDDLPDPCGGRSDPIKLPSNLQPPHTCAVTCACATAPSQYMNAVKKFSQKNSQAKQIS